MGLLDQLRKETEKARTAEKTEKKRRADLQKYYDEEVNPKIELIYDFLKELEQHLNYLGSKIITSYEIPVFGSFENLRQSGYQMDKGRQQVIKRIPFRFICTSEDVLNVVLENNSKVNSVIEYLQKNGLSYESQVTRNNKNQIYGASIKLFSLIPVSIIFEGNINTGGIELTIKNYQTIGSVISYLNPLQINETFLDELGKFIMREDNKFLKAELSKAQKEYFKKMVLEEKLEREMELRDLENQQE